MPIIRKQLKPADVYPENIRYNPDTETVQSLIGDEWVDNPDADPRNQTTFPPRLTSDPACDAAQSITDAFKAQIDGVITAIDGAQSAFTIAGIILSLFSFGVFGIFISLALFLAHAMLDAGTTAINAALTTPVYHTFTCILLCHMDSSGRITAGDLDAVKSDVDDNIGGLGAVILNAMLSLAGEGGINNLASLGTSTGDCSDCDVCDPCATMGDWVAQLPGTLGSIISYGDSWIDVQAEYYSGYAQYVAYINSGHPEDFNICCTLSRIQRSTDGGTTFTDIGLQTHVLCGDDFTTGTHEIFTGTAPVSINLVGFVGSGGIGTGTSIIRFSFTV
jgi:hypothetical protein